jgi:hypothetical protein
MINLGLERGPHWHSLSLHHLAALSSDSMLGSMLFDHAFHSPTTILPVQDTSVLQLTCA